MKDFGKKLWGEGKSLVWGDSEVGSNCMWLFLQCLPESGLEHLWFWGSNQPSDWCLNHELGRLHGWKLFKAHISSCLSKCSRVGWSILSVGARTAPWRAERKELYVESGMSGLKYKCLQSIPEVVFLLGGTFTQNLKGHHSDTFKQHWKPLFILMASHGLYSISGWANTFSLYCGIIKALDLAWED